MNPKNLALKPYNYIIDTIMIEILYKREKMSYGEIKRALERELTNIKHKATSISSDTFSDRLNYMTTSDHKISRYKVIPLLKKKDNGRGNNVIYWLTDKARKRYSLKLPLIKIDSERETAYQLLFYYLKADTSILSSDTISKYTFRSEIDFHVFLSRIHMNMEDFHVIDQRYDEVNRCNFVRMIDSHENIEISKREYTDKGHCVYRYKIPGITAKDISEADKLGFVFEHLFDPGVTQKPLNILEIQELLDILENERLIRKIQSPILLYLEEIRYELTNTDLHKLFNECWLRLFGGVHDRMMFTWKNFRNPTGQEVYWYRLIWGRRRANSFFAGYKNNLIKQKNNNSNNTNSLKPIKKYIGMYDREIPKKFDAIQKDYDNTIKNYNYPSETVLGIVYPQFLRELHAIHKI